MGEEQLGTIGVLVGVSRRVGLEAAPQQWDNATAAAVRMPLPTLTAQKVQLKWLQVLLVPEISTSSSSM